jgi:RNA 2',3'-cyclic 3'-phosphodiesterase
MHLTLRFMGDTREQEIKKIIQAMAVTAAACVPFTLFAKGVGVFPGIKKARVIWSGVKGEINRLEMVQTTLEKNLAREVLTADNRRFSPHFTLGRFKGRVDTKKLATLIQTLESRASAPCVITSMVLFKSDLTPLGAVHTPLFKTGFVGNPTGPDASGL